MSKKEYIQDKSEALEHKVNLLMGFGFLIIAILIISVNLICRFIGGSKARLYEYTDGVVIKAKEHKTYPFGGYGRPAYDYEIKVEYVPEGENRAYVFWDYSYAYENIDVGETLRIYYMKDDPDEAYAARKDWLTSRYLPAENRYNIPLAISTVLIIIGIYFFIDNHKSRKKKR